MAAMATPVRRKRNFKALQLDVTKSAQQTTSPVETQVAPTIQPVVQPVPTRNAPQAVTNGRRRPPPMNLAPAKTGTTSTTDENLLNVSNTPNSAPVTGTVSATRPAYHTDLTQKLANMDMNAETKYDLKNDDLKELQELGQGNGGSVKKVEHVPSGKIMAKKVCSFFMSFSTFFLAVVSSGHYFSELRLNSLQLA